MVSRQFGLKNGQYFSEVLFKIQTSSIAQMQQDIKDFSIVRDKLLRRYINIDISRKHPKSWRALIVHNFADVSGWPTVSEEKVCLQSRGRQIITMTS